MKGEDRRREMMELFWGMIEEAMERPELYPDHLTVIALSDVFKAQLFTPRRLQLIKTLQMGPAASISELAKRVKRPIASVSRDLKVLHAYGLVELRRSGRFKVPVLTSRHIVIPLTQPSAEAAPASAKP